MAKSKELSVTEKISIERNRLEKLYQDMDDAKKQLAAGLIEEAAFMRVQLEELRRDLQNKGWYEPFSQGNQAPYERARPAGQTYNTLNANYQKIIKQLDGMLPKIDATPKEESDGFDVFVEGRDEA